MVSGLGFRGDADVGGLHPLKNKEIILINKEII